MFYFKLMKFSSVKNRQILSVEKKKTDIITELLMKETIRGRFLTPTTLPILMHLIFC